jgi:hypothetical protein
MPGPWTERQPSKPLGTSRVSADREFAAWVAENNYDTIVDGDGVSWKLTLTLDERPGDDPKKLLFQASAELQTTVSRLSLTKHGTYSEVNDRRLLDLFDSAQLPLVVNGFTFRATSREDLRKELTVRLPALRKTWAGRSFHQLKRKLVEEAIEAKCRFAERPKSV